MRLPKKLLEKLTVYFYHRDKQHLDQWNKQADLEAIDSVAVKHGFRFVAVSGTFWFTRGKKTIVCNSSNYLDGGDIFNEP